jgi:hypothetical protein
MRIIHNTLILFSLVGYTITATATPLYDENFDSAGAAPSITPNPILSLPNYFLNRYGPGNMFEVTDTSAHSGEYSLRFTYEGRNGLCNGCGYNLVNHKQGLDGVNYFVADTGEDLTLLEDNATGKLNDGPAAKPGRLLFNTTNDYSKWQIVSVDNELDKNDKLTVKLLKGGIGSKTPEFNGNDQIAIARQCGVDGHVGGNDINKRSDCDDVVIWFANVPPQAEGTSIFRRQYLKAEITSPLIHQKLHYLRPGNGTAFPQGIVLGVDSNPPIRELKLQLTNFKPLGKDAIYATGLNNGFEGLVFERSEWFYLEEEYHAATFNGSTYNNNGSYRLWFSKAGSEPAENAPTFELLNIPLPPITGGTASEMSLWGNFQHDTHSRGSWYIDDVKIADSFNGAVPQSITAKNVAPPQKALVN